MKKSVCCIAFCKNKILIAHRNPTGQMGNRWEFPGGKVEAHESDEETVRREMKEEFSCGAEVIEKITEGKFSHDGKESLLEVYSVKLEHDGLEKKYILTEHSEYKWVEIENIPKDNFVDSDLSVYPAVVEYLKRKFNI